MDCYHIRRVFYITALLCGITYGQRIVTIQMEGTQYYVSKMNPYSSEMNYFLAYQYCRSIGLQLVSFETKEKADSMAEYLKNAGYSQFDFWTSGNHIGSNMLLWMSTGMPFNSTFNYLRKSEGDDQSVPNGPLPMGRKKRGNGLTNAGCIAMKAHELDWDTEDCSKPKDFICEQTRCYFYNYGSIPVSAAQGNHHHHHHNNKNQYSTSAPFKQSQTTVTITHPTHFTTASTTPSPPPYVETTSLYENHPETTLAPEISETTELYEENSNEIDLNARRDVSAETTPEVEVEPTTERVEPSSPSFILRNRYTKILENRGASLGESRSVANTARNMPSEVQKESLEPQSSFPWAWAKNILLEKPKSAGSAANP